MMIELSTMAASFMLVFLRAIQQQNVIHAWYWPAVATSYGIAVAEVAVVLFVVKAGWDAVLWVGTGGAIGVTSAMLMHGLLRQVRARRESS